MYNLGRKEDLHAALRHDAKKHIRAALALLRHGERNEVDDSIHSARKHLKNVRALLRLVRNDIGRKRFAKMNRCLRESCRGLSGLRDSVVAAATMKTLLARDVLPTTSRKVLHSALEARIAKARNQLFGSPRQCRAITENLRKSLRLVNQWSPSRAGWETLSRELRGTYRRGRVAARRAARNVSNESLHELRKRTKELLHVCEFLEQRDSKHFRSMIRSTQRLAELLGQDRDLAVLEDLARKDLHGQFSAVELERILLRAAKRRARLQTSARKRARTLYAARWYPTK
jgi:CHAD domain-containing protein